MNDIFYARVVGGRDIGTLCSIPSWTFRMILRFVGYIYDYIGVRNEIGIAPLDSAPWALGVPVRTITVNVEPRATFTILLPQRDARCLAPIDGRIGDGLAFGDQVAIGSGRSVIGHTFGYAILVALWFLDPIGELAILLTYILGTLGVFGDYFILFAIGDECHDFVLWYRFARDFVKERLDGEYVELYVVILVARTI